MKSLWRAFQDALVGQPDKPFISDEYIAELRERNKQRAQQKIQELGKKWILHPDNHTRKNNERLQQTN